MARLWRGTAPRILSRWYGVRRETNDFNRVMQFFELHVEVVARHSRAGGNDKLFYSSARSRNLYNFSLSNFLPHPANSAGFVHDFIAKTGAADDQHFPIVFDLHMIGAVKKHCDTRPVNRVGAGLLWAPVSPAASGVGRYAAWPFANTTATPITEIAIAL